MDRTGMYWGDFSRLIDRNKKPWRVIKYYKSNAGFANTRSICDFSFPHRNPPMPNPMVLFEDNWYQRSFICNASDFEGWIPFADQICLWNDLENKWEKKPARGLRSVVRLLVAHDCIEKAPEIEEILDARVS